MSDSTDVKIARVEERLAMILDQLEMAREGRKQQYEKIEDLSHQIVRLSSRMEAVEKSLASNAPTINEFISIKQKVIGAGIVGRWVWALAAGTVTLTFTMRDTILQWFNR